MPRLSAILLGLTVFVASAAPLAAHDDGYCADHRISAKAISTAGDIQAFVRCAAEYVQEHGTDEARRAFNEDERWQHGPVYVFVDGVAESGKDSTTFVFPPDPSREGSPWGTSIDTFGTDYFFELHRILSVVDEGWIYYAFGNPATGRDEPKSSYVVEIDWDGNRAAVGAGLYANDQPGTCNADEVNAANLASDPTDRKLQEFVRCAALMVESEGYFATHELERNPRWTEGGTYVFVMDMMGNQLMSSNRFRVNGNALHEWGGGGNHPEAFGGRDVVSVGDSFGESFIYYRSLNPFTGQSEPKVGMLKRTVAYGIPVLVGSGYYLPFDHPVNRPSCSDNVIAASAVRSRRDIRALVNCAVEYIAEHGTHEAYWAFHEGPQWVHHEYYVFVRLLEQEGQTSRLVAYPPDQSREGIPGTSLHDVPDTVVGDYLRELHRIADTVGSGWIHYYFINRETGMIEPKSSYVEVTDWNGQRAVVAAGIFERDLPGTCHREQVNAASLEVSPSESRLQEFVRCASIQVESLGLFAAPVFQRDSRWKSGPIEVLAVNAATRELEFSGSETEFPFQEFVSEAFGGRDVVGMVETFGEAFWYYIQSDADSGTRVPKVAFVRRVLAQGVPFLVGSDYPLLPESDSPRPVPAARGREARGGRD